MRAARRHAQPVLQGGRDRLLHEHVLAGGERVERDAACWAEGAQMQTASTSARSISQR